MANGVFNIAKGRVNEYVNRVASNDPTNAVLVMVLLRVSEADATLRDYDTLAALLGGANTEADFTNYARIQLDQAVLSNPIPDDTNDWQASDFEDQTWVDAGGAANNTLTKLIICYDPDSTAGTDAALIPLTHHDFAVTTDGNDLVAQIDPNGFYRAT